MAVRKQSSSEAVTVSRVVAGEFPVVLLDWYDVHKRDLPWRRTDDPYAILVSEFMLQQTQVATVIPFFERFMIAFPTLEALAAADEQAVLHQWSGLGYYSRARNLHAAACRIVDDCGGEVPSSVAELLFLPGVGRYVAGAVASIAHGIAVGAVDTNVSRILCRVFVLKGLPTSPRMRQTFEELSSRLISRERPGDYNQAMMELGAEVCVAARPKCAICPLRSFCQAYEAGNPLDYPEAKKKQVTVAVEEACAVLRDGERYLLVRRPSDSGRYRNMWEFPGLEISGESADEVRVLLAAWLREEFGVSAQVEDEWAEIKHQVTHHKISKRVFRCSLEKGKLSVPAEAAQWVSVEEIRALPLGAPHKRILSLLGESADFFSL